MRCKQVFLSHETQQKHYKFVMSNQDPKEELAAVQASFDEYIASSKELEAELEAELEKLEGEAEEARGERDRALDELRTLRENGSGGDKEM